VRRRPRRARGVDGAPHTAPTPRRDATDADRRARRPRDRATDRATDRRARARADADADADRGRATRARTLAMGCAHAKPAGDAALVDARAVTGTTTRDARAPTRDARATATPDGRANDFQEVSLNAKTRAKKAKGGDGANAPIAKPSRVDDAMVKEMEAAVESVAKPTATGVKTIPKPKPKTATGGTSTAGGEKSKSQRKNERKRERAKQKKLEDKARIASASMKNSVNTERDLY